MSVLTRKNVLEFKKILFKQNIPELLKTGTKTLKPIESWKLTTSGNVMVSTEPIITFFFTAVEPHQDLSIQNYLDTLDLLLRVLSEDSDGFEFESDPQVPETDIQAADNTLTVKYLTKNLIITYFSRFKGPDGRINRELCKNEFSELIAIANQGRDYRRLVGNTLRQLVETLQAETSWDKGIGHIHGAALVCRLVGARLPQIESPVLQSIITRSRQEIRHNIDMLGRVITSRRQLIKEATDRKQYLKSMKKLDSASKKTVDTLSFHLQNVYALMEATGIPIHSFLGSHYESVKDTLVMFVFNTANPFDTSLQQLSQINLTGLKFRMHQLMDHPPILRFMTYFQNEKKYLSVFSRLLTHYFKTLTHTLDQMISDTKEVPVMNLEIQVNDLGRLLESFEFDASAIAAIRAQTHHKYLTLIEKCAIDQLADIVTLKEAVSDILGDRTRQLYEDVRDALMNGCARTILNIDPSDALLSPERIRQIKNIMSNTYFSFQPRRFFYPVFMKKYVGMPGLPPSETLKELLSINRPAVLCLLEYLSKLTPGRSDLLSQDQMAYCRTLLEQLCGTADGSSL